MQPRPVSFQIGPWRIPAQAVLAPMVGVTDRPFAYCAALRGRASRFGNAHADQRLWHTTKSRQRMNTKANQNRAWCSSPAMIRNSSQRRACQRGSGRADHRYQHGLSGEEVYGKLCGSALLGDPCWSDASLRQLGCRNVPVTVKIRTGIDRMHLNSTANTRIAAESAYAPLQCTAARARISHEGAAEYEPFVKCVLRPRFPSSRMAILTTRKKLQQCLNSRALQQ